MVERGEILRRGVICVGAILLGGVALVIAAHDMTQFTTELNGAIQAEFGRPYSEALLRDRDQFVSLYYAPQRSRRVAEMIGLYGGTVLAVAGLMIGSTPFLERSRGHNSAEPLQTPQTS